MFTRNARMGAACLFLALVPLGALAQTKAVRYGFGAPATPGELSKFFSIPPDGRGLPPGSGTAAKGAQVYAQSCTACHGDQLQGTPHKTLRDAPLIRGRRTPATN